MLRCILGHDWQLSSAQNTDCVTVRQCRRCGKSETKVTHDFDDWTFCIPNSVQQERFCRRCQATETRNHDWQPPRFVDEQQALQYSNGLRDNAMAKSADGQTRLARDLYRKAIIVFPESISARSLWGQMERNLNNFESARLLFREAVALQEFHAQSWMDWGILEQRDGNLDKARELFQRSAKAKAKNSAAWHSWAILEKNDGFFHKARELFKQATRMNPLNAVAWQAWGIMERDLEDIPEARLKFHTAMGVNADSPAAYQAWSVMEFQQGNIQKAVELIETARELEAENVHILIAMGEIFSGSGESSKANSALRLARDLLNKHIAMNGSDARAHNLLGKTMILLEDFNTARAVIERSLSISLPAEKHYAHHILGSCMWAAGQRQEAIVQWENALRLSPYYLASRKDLHTKANIDAYAISRMPRRPDDMINSAFRMLIGDIEAASEAPFISKWYSEKGYGFIAFPGSAERDVFFHISNVRNPAVISTGARVKCEVANVPKGKEARNIQIL